MKECITANKYRILSAVIILGGWFLLSLIFPPLVVPKISVVLRRIGEILSSAKMWRAIGVTMQRLLTGLTAGILIGCLFGVLSGLFEPFREIWRPIQGVIQVVPPISWLILAIIWLGYNGKPAIFIVIMAVIPGMAICIRDGIDEIDEKLVDVGRVFRFSKWKMLTDIYIPSVLPQFFSGLRISIGTAVKTVVMGEVLTTTSGIGGQITTARMNIEPETVIAWTVILVGMFVVTMIAGKICGKIYRGLKHAGHN